MSTDAPRVRPRRPPKAPVRPLARVLVVEADPRSLAAIGDALDAAGILSVRVRSGEAALSHEALASVSVVVCALEMPKTDGLEVLLALRGDPSTAAVPVVFVTNRALDEAEALARQFGGQGALSRPIEPQALVALVRRLAELE